MVKMKPVMIFGLIFDLVKTYAGFLPCINLMLVEEKNEVLCTE
jgi:ribosome-associated toxin RatA of RatAB toxin-antitoxin module